MHVCHDWDGAVWFVEILAGQVGRIDADGHIEEFPLPDRSARPHAITSGANGMWFTQWGANRIGHIGEDRKITEFELPETHSEPHGIALDNDQNIWVALESGAVLRAVPQ